MLKSKNLLWLTLAESRTPTDFALTSPPWAPWTFRVGDNSIAARNTKLCRVKTIHGEPSVQFLNIAYRRLRRLRAWLAQPVRYLTGSKSPGFQPPLIAGCSGPQMRNKAKLAFAGRGPGSWLMAVGAWGPEKTAPAMAPRRSTSSVCDSRIARRVRFAKWFRIGHKVLALGLKGLVGMNPSVRQRAVQRLAFYLAWMSVPSVFCQTIPSSNQTSNQTSPAAGQAGRAAPAQVSPPPAQLPRRIFGVIPNYRSHPSLKDSMPLTSGDKFKLAARDSFDPGTFLLTGFFAGIGQASNSTPSYGQGMAGYGRYYGSNYGDFLIGNVMTEGVFPSLLHQDPRYFRRGTGTSKSRLGYAMGQIFVTHGDNRRTQFNYSEIGGNATAVAISNAYNPDNRNASDAAARLAIQLAVDMAGNILKEFTPDLYRRFRSKKHVPSSSGKHP